MNQQQMTLLNEYSKLSFCQARDIKAIIETSTSESCAISRQKKYNGYNPKDTKQCISCHNILSYEYYTMKNKSKKDDWNLNNECRFCNYMKYVNDRDQKSSMIKILNALQIGDMYFEEPADHKIDELQKYATFSTTKRKYIDVGIDPDEIRTCLRCSEELTMSNFPLSKNYPKVDNHICRVCWYENREESYKLQYDNKNQLNTNPN